MGINVNNLMPQLSPMGQLPPLQFGGDSGGGSSKSMERERLRLMREQFEETKRRNLEDEALRRLSEQGDLKRAELGLQKEREQIAAQFAAKQREQAATAYADFYKARDVNDFAGMAAAGERLREFGGLADSLGHDEQGRPLYRVGMSAGAHQEQEADLDAQAAERAGPESLDQSLSRLSALGYDRTQAGVVDQGEFIDQRQAQFGPVMDSIVKSRPGAAYQESARQTGDAVSALGLSPKDSAEMFLKLQSPSDTAVGKELDAVRDEHKLEFQRETDFQKAERAAQLSYEKEMRRAKTAKEQAAVAAAKDGYGNASTLWKEGGLEGVLDSAKQQEIIEFILTNDNPNDDSQIGHMFLKLKGSIGPQSNQEMDEVFGTKDMSLLDQIGAKVRNLLFGGQSEVIKKSLLDIVARGVEENDQKILTYLDRMDQVLSSKETSEEAKRGWRQFRDSIPAEYREGWDEDRAQRGLPAYEGSAEPKPEDEEAPAQGTPVKADLHTGITADDEFMDVFTEHAINAGIDPELVLPLINYESGGNPQAENTAVSSEGVRSNAKGLIQFTNRTARRYGFKDSAEFAKLSAAEQAPYIIRYLVDAGIDETSTQGDVYVAIGASGGVKKSNDTVLYRKDADTAVDRAEYELNAKNWDLDRDGKITRGEIYQVGASRKMPGERGKKKPEGSALAPVGGSSAPPGPAAARARAEQEEEPESAEDGIPDTTPSRALKKQAGKKHKNAGELDALME